ncbi:formylglycine-generating enzyme family protein [Micropruina sp.]|uniref:formylglycine-generating enzyme family protein n=1 Tax=Micropruina sp. TaxID=2737536 RepID=UPI0039E47651
MSTRLAAIPEGSVRIKDARRKAEREVHLMPFRIGVVPVTVAEFATGRCDMAAHNGLELPATGVRWFDAVAWCNTASQADDLEPAYRFDGDRVRWNAAADGYRLPTEAEWVYACFGGGTRPQYGALVEIAWTAKDDISRPQPVARKKANGYGLFDTLGNVWEWCWDRLDPARYADYRVLKGGGWADPEWSCRSDVRRGSAPDALVEDVGFRVVRGTVATSADADGGQGWTERGDRERATMSPLPTGWTPLLV